MKNQGEEGDQFFLWVEAYYYFYFSLLPLLHLPLEPKPFTDPLKHLYIYILGPNGTTKMRTFFFPLSVRFI